MSDTPRIVIAASEHERIAALVLEYTIRKHAAGEVEIIHTFDREDRPTRGVWEEGGKDGTRFTWVRFWVPELCGFQGRAIYLDSDMIVFADIADLWNTPMGDKALLRTKDPSVLLIDCEKCRWHVDQLIDMANQARGSVWNVDRKIGLVTGDHAGSLDEAWNHRDTYEEGQTKLLHYTNMNTQPWPNHRHDKCGASPYADLWFDALRETVDNGLLSAEELPEALREKVDAPERERVS